MDAHDSTLNAPLKQCRSKDKCVNALGAWMPATTEYFSRNKRNVDGLQTRCKACDAHYYQEHRDRIIFLQEARMTPETIERDRERSRVNSKRRYGERREELLADRSDYYYNRGGKAKREARRQRPDVKEAEHQRKSTPEYKEKRRAWSSTPENIAKRREYSQRPENKDRASQRQRERRARALQVPVETLKTRRPLTVEERQLKAVADEVKREKREKAKPRAFTASDWKQCLAYFEDCCAVCGRDLSDPFGDYTAAADHWIPISSVDCPGTIPSNIVPLCHGKGGCNNSKHNRHPIEWLVKKFGQSQADEIFKRVEAYFEWLKGQGIK